MSRRALSPDQAAEAAALRDAGRTLESIAARFGCGREAVKTAVGGSLAGRQGPPDKWRTCEHYFGGVVRGLRYPDGEKYGTLVVCVRCRARRFEFFESGEVRIDPPIPIRQFRHRTPADLDDLRG